MSAMRVYREHSIYVIGTFDAHVACAAAGISPETHRWTGTEFGWWVRRNREWRWAGYGNDTPANKAARPGVCFVGPVRPTGEGAAS